MAESKNKGEWSELYAFIKLLKDGRIYAADEAVNKIENIYLPIIKIIREETEGDILDYHTGDKIKIYKDNRLLKEVSASELETSAHLLFANIFTGSKKCGTSGSFSVDEIKPFMDNMLLKKVKAPSKEKIDILMQIHDINTGYSPEVGFSIKSDLGSPPTLLNPGKNTRIKYKVYGISSNMQ